MSKKMIILKTAAGLFARQGFKDTSMAELSEATGVAGGTIFYHFKNKETLFLAVLADVRHTLLTEYAAHFSRPVYTNGLAMVEGAISFYLRLAGDMGDQILLLHRHDPYKLAEVNGDCRRHLEDIYDCLLDVFENAIRVGQKDGTIRDMPARKAAMIVFAAVDGILRLNTYKIYNGGALYNDLLMACRRMIQT